METLQFQNKIILNENSSIIQSKTRISDLNSSSDYSNTGVNWGNVQLNITLTEDAFIGYNLFVLEEENLTDHNKTYSLFIVDMTGNVIFQRDLGTSTDSILTRLNTEFINASTLLYGTPNGPAFWNLKTNKTMELEFVGHHEYEYNPNDNTIFTLGRTSVEIEGVKYLYDTIDEYNMTGHLIWSLDTRTFINVSQYCPFNDTIGIYADLTHGNTVFFDADEDVFYFNARNVNTFYKIDHRSGEVIWGLGQYGDFSLYDKNKDKKNNLFYHAHAIEKVDNNTFILFDNDLHNFTNPNNYHSRILEIVINEDTMTANESWTWISPQDYYSRRWGDADRLPNGNRIGTFGTPIHIDDTIGARIVEISPQGEIVWEMNFPKGENSYGIYRMERIRLNPIISPVKNQNILFGNTVNITWQTWYNFRTKSEVIGSYQILLNGSIIKLGTHTFNEFWQESNISISLINPNFGCHNLTLIVLDETGYSSINTVLIDVVAFYINKEGPVVIEQGQQNAIIQWNGETLSQLSYYLYFNETLEQSGIWNGDDNIIFNLNKLDIGKYFCQFLLYNSSILKYNESFCITLFPAVEPVIISHPLDQEILWNQSLLLAWEVFDENPLLWELYFDGLVIMSDSWDIQTLTINWFLPKLDEGVYNITLIVYDNAEQKTSVTIFVTIISPSPPEIILVSEQTEIIWKQDTTLIWEVHGGLNWHLWRNSSIFKSGVKQSNIICIEINWYIDNWILGFYNLTLEVTDTYSNSSTLTCFIETKLQIGDKYADIIITASSVYYTHGEKALDAPDNEYATIFVDYSNGYITLDMGENEEIIDGDGYDVIIYSMDGFYTLRISNDLSKPFTILGYGEGNQSFDLSSIGFSVARYIRIEYRSGSNVLLDAVEALNYNVPESDTHSPVILESPDNVTTFYTENGEIILFWEVFDISPWKYTITINNDIFESRMWDGFNIEFTFIITSIGSFNIKLTLYDLFGHIADDNVIIIIEKSSNSSTTQIDTETYTTDDASYINFFFLAWFFLISKTISSKFKKNKANPYKKNSSQVLQI